MPRNVVNLRFGPRKKPLTLDEPIHVWKKVARERPEEILQLPLHSLLIIPVEVFDELIPGALLQLPPDVLVRVSRDSPRTLSKVTSRELNGPSGTWVYQLPSAVLANLDPAVLPSIPTRKLATALKEQPEIRKVLSKDLLERVCEVGYRSGVLSEADIAALHSPPAAPTSAPAGLPNLDRQDSSKAVSRDSNDGPSAAAGDSASAAVGAAPRASAETDQESIEVEEDAQLVGLRRQYNELLEHWIDLKSKRTENCERIRVFLHEHGWVEWDWDTDSEALDGIFKFAEEHAGLAAGERERAEHLVLECEKEKTQRMMLQEEVQALIEKLEEQGCREASQDPSEQHEAGIKRLQKLVDKQERKYQAIIQSLVDQHSATVRRVIDEHTAEMSDLMTAYEKELAETRMAHGEQLAQQKQRHWQEVDSLKDSIAVLESRLAGASHDPQSTPENSSRQTANNLPAELPLRISFSSPAQMTEFLKMFVDRRQDETSRLTSAPRSTAHSAPSNIPSGKT
jgi:hypothetical protein